MSASRAPEYGPWLAMRSRCHVPTSTAYAAYGGRGIFVCEEMRSNFYAFLATVGERPSDRHSVDRIDPFRGYDCGACDDCDSRGAEKNVRWASPREQARNKRGTERLTIQGQTRPIAEWAEHFGISATTIRARLRRGLSPSQAVNYTPAKRSPAREPNYANHSESCSCSLSCELAQMRRRIDARRAAKARPQLPLFAGNASMKNGKKAA